MHTLCAKRFIHSAKKRHTGAPVKPLTAHTPATKPLQPRSGKIYTLSFNIYANGKKGKREKGQNSRIAIFIRRVNLLPAN
jgi:hypothetical protein